MAADIHILGLPLPKMALGVNQQPSNKPEHQLLLFYWNFIEIGFIYALYFMVYLFDVTYPVPACGEGGIKK